MLNDDTLNIPAIITPEYCAEAFERIRAEAEALSEHRLVTYNVNATSAAATILGAAPKIAAYETRIVAQTPMSPIAAIRKLPLYAAALLHADTEFLAATEPKEPFARIAERALALRTALNMDVSVLVKRGVFEPTDIEDFDGTTAHKAVATDLRLLARVMRGRWSSIAGRTLTTEADLDEANVLAFELTRAIGMREQTPESVAEATRTRQRVFTLLLTAYTAARNAITFICATEGMGEVDVIAPNLYVSKRIGSARARDEPVADGAKANAPIALAPDDDPFMA